MAAASRTELAPALLPDASWWGTLAAARDLGSRGVPVTLAAEEPLSPACFSRHVTRVVRCPPSTRPEPLLQWLLEFGRRFPGHVLYPTSDELAWLVAAHRDQLASRFRLFTPTLGALVQLLDKARLGCLAQEAGVPVPMSWCPRDEQEVRRLAREARFPLHVKPRTQVFARGRGKGERVDRPEGLLAAWRRWRALAWYPACVSRALEDAYLPLVQESLGLSERIYTVDGFADASGAVRGALGCVKVLQRPRGSGPGICFEDAEVPAELAGALARMFQTVSFRGVFDAEFVEAGGRRLLIDVNPRFYNHMAFEAERGLPLAWCAYLAALGESAQLQQALESSARPHDGPRIYVHRLPMRLMVAAQSISGGLSPADRRRWRLWREQGREATTDPAGGYGDPWPAVAEVLVELRAAARHPRSWLRGISRH
jgi:predicted ATP-grasp superfamily ATP-dependent carboligase